MKGSFDLQGREVTTHRLRTIALTEVMEWLLLAPGKVCMSPEKKAIPLVPRPG